MWSCSFMEMLQRLRKWVETIRWMLIGYASRHSMRTDQSYTRIKKQVSPPSESLPLKLICYFCTNLDNFGVSREHKNRLLHQYNPGDVCVNHRNLETCRNKSLMTQMTTKNTAVNMFKKKKKKLTDSLSDGRWKWISEEKLHGLPERKHPGNLQLVVHR